MPNRTQYKWSALLINGTIALAIGLIFVFLPYQLIETSVMLIGIVLGLSGVSLLLYTFFNNRKTGLVNSYNLLQGVLNLAVGLAMAGFPDKLIQFVFFIIGLWILAIGLFQIVYAFKLRKVTPTTWHLMAINGLAFSILGLLMMFNPEFIISTALTLMGLLISLLGIVLLFLGWTVYKSNTETNLT